MLADIPTLPIFPHISQRLVHSPSVLIFPKSPDYWCGSITEVQVIKTKVALSDKCGNGVINLSFVPKLNVFRS